MELEPYYHRRFSVHRCGRRCGDWDPEMMTGASEGSTGSLLKRRMFLLWSMTCLLQPGVQDLELAVPVNRSTFSHLTELQ